MAGTVLPPKRKHPQPLCALCEKVSAIYACPGCSTPTCSLPCARNHKASTGCTGERNKVGYVPMNRYGWGTMMSDYVFLEDLERRVGEWGREIVKGRYATREFTSGKRGRGGFCGRGGRGNVGNAKRDTVQLQLEARDITMELLPVGMERRKVNQSYWESKSQKAFLTVEFKFNPPSHSLALSPEQQQSPFVIVTHKNSIDKPLLSLIQRAAERGLSKTDMVVPEWARHLVIPHPDDPESFRPPDCVMKSGLHSRLSFGTQQGAYFRFDSSQTLGILLKRTCFTEFPTIEIWEEFKGTIVDPAGVVSQNAEEERQPKRRRITAKEQRKAMSTLLGNYGSDDEMEAETYRPRGLSQLGDYTASDEDLDGTDDNGEDELDAAVLLELVRQAQGTDQRDAHAEDEDKVDWGEEDEEAEEPFA